MSGFLNEWRFILRQPMVWLCVVGTSAFAGVLVEGLSVPDVVLAKRLTLLNITIMMLTIPIVVGVLIPTLLQRDSLSRMHELIQVTPVSTRQRLLNRFFAFFTLLIAITFSEMLIQLLLLSQHAQFDVEVIGTAILNQLVLFLPNQLLYSAVAIFLSQRLQHAMPVYVFFALSWVGYVILGSLTGSPVLAGSKVASEHLYWIMQWGDPMGFTAIFSQYEDSRTQWLITPQVVINRFIWLSVSLGLLWFALKNSAMQSYDQSRSSGIIPRTWQIIRQATNTANQPSFTQPAVAYTPLVAVTTIACKTLLHNRVTLLILAMYGASVFSEVMAGMDYAEPLTVLTPTSLDALNRVVWNLLPFSGCVLMILWSWQLGWQNLRDQAAEIIAATPVKNFQITLGQGAALFVMWLILLTLTALFTALAQWRVSSVIDFGFYLQTLLLTGLPVLLFGIICLAVHHLCRTPMAAGAICLLLLLAKFTPLMSLLNLSHPLWDVAGTPLQPADTRIGYEASITAFGPFMGIWLSISLMLLSLSCWRTHRGTGLTLTLWRRLPPQIWCATIVFAAALCGFHYTLQSENPLMSAASQHAFQAEYEKQYGDWAERPQPMMTHIDARVDFYPQKRQASVALTMQLTNLTATTINEVLVRSYPGFAPDELFLENAKLIRVDGPLQQYVFRLNAPLQAKQTLHLHANLTVSESQLWTSPSHQILHPSFSYLRSVPMLPAVGFDRRYTLREKVDRAQYDLPPLKLPLPSMFNRTPPTPATQAQRITLHSIVSTPTGYSGFTQGKLERSWNDNGRAYQEYTTQSAIRNIPAWFATPMTVTSTHISHAGRMIDLNLVGIDNEKITALHVGAVNNTFDWFANNIKPYDYNQLTLLFIPDIGPSGYALPQFILLNHTLAVRAHPAPHAGFDQRYRRTVHEVAHQWFGHQIGFGVDADRVFLIESLATYAELVIIEKHQGKRAMQALVEYEQSRYRDYLRGKTDAPVALIDATSNADMYSRATLVFAKLRTLIGDDAIQHALKTLFRANKVGVKPVTSMDFVNALLEGVPHQQQTLVRELLLGTDITNFVQTADVTPYSENK